MNSQNSQEIMNSLFNEVKKSFSDIDISNKLGIHSNTIKRWTDLNSIPSQYFNDFNRILGKNADNVTIM